MSVKTLLGRIPRSLAIGLALLLLVAALQVATLACSQICIYCDCGKAACNCTDQPCKCGCGSCRSYPSCSPDESRCAETAQVACDCGCVGDVCPKHCPFYSFPSCCSGQMTCTCLNYGCSTTTCPKRCSKEGKACGGTPVTKACVCNGGSCPHDSDCKSKNYCSRYSSIPATYTPCGGEASFHDCDCFGEKCKKDDGTPNCAKHCPKAIGAPHPCVEREYMSCKCGASDCSFLGTCGGRDYCPKGVTPPIQPCGPKKTCNTPPCGGNGCKCTDRCGAVASAACAGAVACGKSACGGAGCTGKCGLRCKDAVGTECEGTMKCGAIPCGGNACNCLDLCSAGSETRCGGAQSCGYQPCGGAGCNCAQRCKLAQGKECGGRRECSGSGCKARGITPCKCGWYCSNVQYPCKPPTGSGSTPCFCGTSGLACQTTACPPYCIATSQAYCTTLSGQGACCKRPATSTVTFTCTGPSQCYTINKDVPHNNGVVLPKAFCGGGSSCLNKELYKWTNSPGNNTAACNKNATLTPPVTCLDTPGCALVYTDPWTNRIPAKGFGGNGCYPGKRQFGTSQNWGCKIKVTGTCACSALFCGVAVDWGGGRNPATCSCKGKPGTSSCSADNPTAGLNGLCLCPDNDWDFIVP